MKRITFYLFILVTGASFWMILNEKASLYLFLTGLFFSAASVYITEKILLGPGRRFDFNLPFSVFYKYPLYMLSKIYSNGLFVLVNILKGRIVPKVTTISTDLTDSLAVSLLANSITLTPGTISIDKSGKKIIVLYLDLKDGYMPDPEGSIKKKYEKILGGGRKKDD